GDDQGIATSLGSVAMIDAAEGNFERAEANFAAATEAYERAGMAQAAEGLRATREALVVQRVPVDDLVHRQRWTPGTVIVRRDMWLGRPWYAAAGIVVEDTPERLAVFSPDATEARVPTKPGIIAQMAEGSWDLGHYARYNQTLGLYQPGAGYSV